MSSKDWQSEGYEPNDPGVNAEDARAMQYGFHGGGRNLVDRKGRPTDKVMAAADRGITNSHQNYDQSPSHFVNYVTPNPVIQEGGTEYDYFDVNDEDREPAEDLRHSAEMRAWKWAEKAGQGRPRVYEGRAGMRSKRPVGMDANIYADLEVDRVVDMAAGSFKVTDTHWIPQGITGKSVQGTLPHVNWNQFGAPNVGNPEDVAFGLTGLDRLEGKRRRERKEADAAAARPLHGPALEGIDARDEARKNDESGQMRLPGFKGHTDDPRYY